MTSEELKDLLNLIQRNKCETQTLEIKRAETDCPKRLYDTLSSFSNQDGGGVIVFGICEEDDYEEVGVYDPQDLQKKINEQCLQMSPVVRPLLTVAEKNERFFVSAEIPGLDAADRPCFYSGKGRLKGSYARVGDSDEPMTEYEIYSYEAFRRRYQDELREVSRASIQTLNQPALEEYLIRLKNDKPRLASLSDDTIRELMSITRGGEVTLASAMLFSPYPQAYFPQLCIIATALPGTERGELAPGGERFIDNMRIEGTIPEMLNEALAFVRRNMKTSTTISSSTGERTDKTDYPIAAVREAVLNALVHRDYSIHTEGMPITLEMFADRIEIGSPGGLYGRICVDQLGRVQPDTRNPVIAAALETLDVTENRYSGIPTIRRELEQHGLPEAEFINSRGSFITVFYKENSDAAARGDRQQAGTGIKSGMNYTQTATALDSFAMEYVPQSSCVSSEASALEEFCRQPRTRAEIAAFLKLESQAYAITTYVTPLVKEGRIKLSIPDKPRSPKQLYYYDE